MVKKKGTGPIAALVRQRTRRLSPTHPCKLTKATPAVIRSTIAKTGPQSRPSSTKIDWAHRDFSPNANISPTVTRKDTGAIKLRARRGAGACLRLSSQATRPVQTTDKAPRTTATAAAFVMTKLNGSTF